MPWKKSEVKNVENSFSDYNVDEIKGVLNKFNEHQLDDVLRLIEHYASVKLQEEIKLRLNAWAVVNENLERELKWVMEFRTFIKSFLNK